VNAVSSDSSRRRPLWYAKWLFACFGCGFALTLFICTAALPFVGMKLFDLWPTPAGRFAMFALMVASGPILFRKLR
jgi:hypothetical protein